MWSICWKGAVVPEQYSDKLVLQAKFGVAVEKWMEVNEIDADRKSTRLNSSHRT